MCPSDDRVKVKRERPVVCWGYHAFSIGPISGNREMCIDPFHLGEEMSDLSGGKVERGGRDDENSVWSQENGETRDRAENIIGYSLAMRESFVYSALHQVTTLSILWKPPGALGAKMPSEGHLDSRRLSRFKHL